MATRREPTVGDTQPSAGLTRRQFLPLLGAAAMATSAPRSAAGAQSAADSRYVYVGTYTAPGVPPGGTHPSMAVGIYVFKMNPRDGKLTLVQVVPAVNPSFLALDPTLTHLYSANEDDRRSRQRVRDRAGDGELTFLNSAAANGAAHDPRQRAPVRAVPLRGKLHDRQLLRLPHPARRLHRPDDGPVPERRQRHRAEPGPPGRSARAPDPDRPRRRHVFGVDLGADKVNVWNLDLASGMLTPEHRAVRARARRAPARATWRSIPTGGTRYVLDELVSTITAFNYDPVRGAFVWLQTISTLPEGFSGTNTTAEIRIHPSGQFLYNTNRGHNSVTMYAIDPRRASSR